MHSPALAMAWELWGRNRGGIGVVLTGVLGLALIGFLLPAAWSRDSLIIWSVIYFAVAFLYLISITLYGEIRQGAFMSAFPARMFTLPVRTSLLVLWPMLLGTSFLGLLWLAMALLVWWPAGAEVQWWVLPLLTVSLVWFQAVCWAVPGPPLVKVIVACIVFPAIKMALELITISVARFTVPQDIIDPRNLVDARLLSLTIFSACFLPLGYVVAVWGVARDRRGANQDWLGIGRLIEQVRGCLPRRRAGFSSAAQAQLWFEWRTKGLILPLLPACLLMFFSFVVAPFVEARELLILLLVVTLLVLAAAFFVGYGLGKTSFWGGDLRLTSLQATRPLSSSDLAAAKLRVAARSSLATCTLLLFTFPLWLAIFGKFGEAIEICRPLWQHYSVPQLVLLAACCIVGFFALTWGQLAGGLCLSLTGRAWVVNAVVGLYMVVAMTICVLVPWVYGRPEDFDAILTAVIWSMAVLTMLKLLGASWALVETRRRGLLVWRNLGIVLGIWLLGLSCLLTLVYWMVPADGLLVPQAIGTGINRVPAHLLALAAVLVLPLLRPIAAPLAVAWNRHR